jgi:hypothetical protein
MALPGEDRSTRTGTAAWQRRRGRLPGGLLFWSAWLLHDEDGRGGDVAINRIGDVDHSQRRVSVGGFLGC